MYKIIKASGAVILFSPFRDLESASLGIFIKTGARYEKRNFKGTAHFLEHLLFKGSKKYSYKDIKREIEGRGGILNGFTSQEFCGYYAHFLNKNIKPTLDILIDMVFSPLLKIEDIEKERNIILEEMKMYYDLPIPYSLLLLNKLLWKDHPLGEEVIGNFDSIKRITKKHLLDFKNLFYNPPNIIISCAGDFDIERILKLINEKIKIKQVKKDTNNFLVKPNPLRGMNIKVENKKLNQLHLAIGFRSVPYVSKCRFVVELINIILGANMSSRLFEEVREKRALCYDIASDVKKYKDSGAFIIHLGLDKDKLILALSTVLEELNRIKKTLVSTKELIRAKDYLIGQIVMSLERPNGRMFYMGESYLTEEKIYTLNEIKNKINSINAEQILNLAKQIFSFENICVSCIGDIDKDIEKDIKQIIKTH